LRSATPQHLAQLAVDLYHVAPTGCVGANYEPIDHPAQLVARTTDHR
jgi:hypothetical protein